MADEPTAAAWKDTQVRKWLDEPNAIDVSHLRTRLEEAVCRHYAGRANTLKAIHPLGLQVQLSTGVANGVLVVSSIADCAALLNRIITKTLEFDLVKKVVKNKEYILLQERISGCVFRVSTGDQMLTNAFWNFYLEEDD